MNIIDLLYKLSIRHIVRKRNGVWLTLSLTSKCPNNCAYCPFVKKKNVRTCGIEKWKEFIEKFPERISYVCVSGGEPTMVPWFPEFVNWLIDRGYFVTVYTMLAKPGVFNWINNSWRLYVDATYHKGDDASRFTEAFNMVKTSGMRIDAYELDNENKILDYSKIKKFYKREDMDGVRLLHCPPSSPYTRIIYSGSEVFYK